THIDALCHIWDHGQMWNGRDPDVEVTFDGSTWGGIEAWGDGLVTRGVLLDVPRHRSTDWVTQDDPVHGWELDELCRSRGIEVEPGDALVVYSGREAWEREFGRPWGGSPGQPDDRRPGLHASCLEFLRDSDAAVLVWDMMDMYPDGLDLVWSVH